MDPRKILRELRIVQQRGKKRGEPEIVASALLRIIERTLPQRIAGIRAGVDLMAGHRHAYHNPWIEEGRALRKIFDGNLPVEYTRSEYPNAGGSTVYYDLFLGEEGCRIRSEATQDELEDRLKAEVEALNQLGLKLEYVGEYIPPDA